MPYFQHYSFDLWLTLIRSNSAFKPERAAYFHQNHNGKNKTVEEIALIFRQVDLMCNAINERTGKNIDADEMYLMVINFIHDGELDLDTVDIDKVLADMEALLFVYPPEPYSNVTIDVLQHLKQNSGATFSLLSNTGYITGKTLRKVLKLYGLENYFDFQLYSDEAGLSKPNVEFFRLMMQNVDICHPGTSVPPSGIIHIGDNIKNDIKPADQLGIRSLLVHTDNKTILNLIS